jgi:hypothetical protein
VGWEGTCFWSCGANNLPQAGLGRETNSPSTPLALSELSPQTKRREEAPLTSNGGTLTSNGGRRERTPSARHPLISFCFFFVTSRSLLLLHSHCSTVVAHTIKSFTLFSYTVVSHTTKSFTLFSSGSNWSFKRCGEFVDLRTKNKSKVEAMEVRAAAPQTDRTDGIMSVGLTRIEILPRKTP